MEIRSFLAFELPPAMKEVVGKASQELRKTALNLRWVRVDNIHLTVVFMGQVQAEPLEDMGEDIRKVCSDYGVFHISLKAMGCFPNRRNPRVLWIGLEGDLARMALFRDALQERLLPFGIEIEKRPFKPHLTLGRFRQGDRAMDLDEVLSHYKDISSPVCPLSELILFKSDLKPGGAEYTKLQSCTLSGER